MSGHPKNNDFLTSDPQDVPLWTPPAPVPQKKTTKLESNEELAKRAARAYIQLSRNDTDVTSLTSIATEYANALYGLTYYYGSTSTRPNTALVAMRAAEWTLSAMDFYKLASVAISGVLDRDAPMVFSIQSRVLGSTTSPPTVKDCVAFQQAYRDASKKSVGTLAPLMDQHMRYWQGRAAVCLSRDHYHGQGISGSEVTKVDKILARRYIAYAASRFRDSLPLGKEWHLYAVAAEQRLSQELSRANLSLGVPAMIPPSASKEESTVTFPTPTEWPAWPSSVVDQFDRFLQVHIDTLKVEMIAAKSAPPPAPKTEMAAEQVMFYLLGVKQQPKGITMEAWYWMLLAATRTALNDREALLNSPLVSGVPGVSEQLQQVRDVLQSLNSKFTRTVHT